MAANEASRVARWVVSLAAIAVADAAPMDAGAQRASSTASPEEVVVTARRRTERLQDVPVAVTAVSPAMLQRYAIADITAVTQLVPSMIVGRQVTGSSASIFLRGVGSTSLSSGFDQSVSLNIDGIAMSRGREIVSSQYDLQQVEVLKGPQALFFGKNSTGGVVSISSALPTRELAGGMKTGYEFEADEVYGDAFLSGPWAGDWSARLAAYASQMDGFFDNPSQPNVTNGFERVPNSDRRPEAKALSGRLTFLYEPDSPLRAIVRLSATNHQDSGAADNYERLCAAGRLSPLPTNGVADPLADCTINGRNTAANLPPAIAATMPYARDGQTYTDHNAYVGGVTIEYSWDSAVLTSVTGAYGFKQLDVNNFSGGTAGIYVSQYATFDQASQEFRLLTELDGPLNLMVGLYYADTKFSFDTAALVAPLPVDAVTGRYDSFQRDNGFDGETLSAFTELTYALTSRLELAGGARWTREEKDSFAENVYAHPALAALFPLNRFDDTFKDTNVSPQATLTWRPSRDLTVYGAYKEGFKAGGFNTSISIGPTTTREQGEFDSETAQGFEIGVKSLWFDNVLALNATLYNYDFDDLQVQVFDAATLAQRVTNAGTLRSRGIELDLNWAVRQLKGLELRGALSYNQAEFDDYVGACYAGQTVAEGCSLDAGINGAFNSQDFDGRTAPKAPELSGRIGASYSTALGRGLIAKLSTDAAYTDEYNFTDALRPDGVQDAFTRVDASISVGREDGVWEVALIGRNITDELVVTSANDMPSQVSAASAGTGTVTGRRSDMNAIIERPRQIYLQISTRF